MFSVALAHDTTGRVAVEGTLAEALRARIDGRRQSVIAERMGISQNRLSEILRGEPVEIGKGPLGILRVYPDLWPFFLPADIAVAISREVERTEGAQKDS